MSKSWTPVADIPAVVSSLRQKPQSDANGHPGDSIFSTPSQRQGCLARARTIPLETRKKLLQGIIDFCKNEADALRAAEYEDLRRPHGFHDIIRGGCVKTCEVMLENLEQLVADEKVAVPTHRGATDAFVRKDPLGVVLIIGTWNFPLPLTIKPLAHAIAAGCPCVLKLNEVCVKTSEVMMAKMPQYIANAMASSSLDVGASQAAGGLGQTPLIQLVYGGVEQATALLKERFDLIFYTGNSTVGRIIYKAAADHLTPCVLELGGKNPVFVTKNANLDTALLKLVDTSFMNVGQFCVSPDTIFIDKSKISRDELIMKIKSTISQFHGANPQQSGRYSRIINAHHHSRLVGMLNENHGGIVVQVDEGNAVDESDLYIPPTFVINPRADSKLMTEEIFGPIKVIQEYESLDQVLNYNATLPRPLAAYIFSDSQEEIDLILSSVESGGVCINDCIAHMLDENLPFGGVGESGFGNYRGKWGVGTFCNHRSVLQIPSDNFNPIRLPQKQ